MGLWFAFHSRVPLFQMRTSFLFTGMTIIGPHLENSQTPVRLSCRLFFPLPTWLFFLKTTARTTTKTLFSCHEDFFQSSPNICVVSPKLIIRAGKTSWLHSTFLLVTLSHALATSNLSIVLDYCKYFHNYLASFLLTKVCQLLFSPPPGKS